MNDDISEVKQIVDNLQIENALNSAHLETLTKAFFELSSHLLNKDELSNLKSHFYNALYEKSAELLSQPNLLYRPAKAQFALFDLKCLVDQHLRDLSK